MTYILQEGKGIHANMSLFILLARKALEQFFHEVVPKRGVNKWQMAWKSTEIFQKKTKPN